jgi:hypothetical protein
LVSDFGLHQISFSFLEYLAMLEYLIGSKRNTLVIVSRGTSSEDGLPFMDIMHFCDF